MTLEPENVKNTLASPDTPNVSLQREVTSRLGKLLNFSFGTFTVPHLTPSHRIKKLFTATRGIRGPII